MSDNWGVQASYKFGTNAQSMLNVRAEDADTLKIHLDVLAQGDVLSSLTHLGQVLEAASALTPVTSPAAPAPAPAPSNVTPFPQQQLHSGPVQAPSCPHGVRKFNRGVGAKGPWAAYFCPLEKGNPNACAPDWQRV